MLGIVARVGSIHEQRVALITDLVRADPDDPSEAVLRARLLHRVAETLSEDEIPLFDAGFKVRELQGTGLPRYLVRLAVNYTGRRNALPHYQGRGRRPQYGERVRPLPRRWKGKLISATPPDRTETWREGDIELRAEFWDNLVLSDAKVHPDNPTLNVAAIHDPRFQQPWLLGCPLRLRGAVLRALFRDRWPVEQIALAGKQMLGGARQFVFAPESRQRLPELNLLAGAILTHLAATLPAAPTGFWDRHRKPTPGRLRRLLAKTHFPKSCSLPQRLREKGSVCDHLPKGILGHRRTKHAIST